MMIQHDSSRALLAMHESLLNDPGRYMGRMSLDGVQRVGFGRHRLLISREKRAPIDSRTGEIINLCIRE